jgi:hypothetical protein
MSGVTRRGFEGQIFYGTAGSTASTQLTNCDELDYDNPVEKIETTTRGAGTNVPKKSKKVVAIDAMITWSMYLKDGDTALLALIAAARTGALVAIRTKSYSSGLGFDGDCTVTCKHTKNAKGESKFNFTAEPCDDLRDWEPNI